MPLAINTQGVGAGDIGGEYGIISPQPPLADDSAFKQAEKVVGGKGLMIN